MNRATALILDLQDESKRLHILFTLAENLRLDKYKNLILEDIHNNKEEIDSIADEENIVTIVIDPFEFEDDGGNGK